MIICGGPPILFMQPEQLRQRSPHFAAGHDLIDESMGLLEFAALESFRQLFADGLFNYARSGKTDQSFRFRQHNIAQGCKTGGNTTGGGMSQVADKQSALAGEHFQSRAGFGHLHQAENAFLHTGTAAGAEDDQRQALLRGIFNSTGYFFTYARTHAAHEEPAIQHAHHTGMAVDFTVSGHHRFIQAGTAALVLQFLLIIREMQYVFCFDIFIQFPERAGIQNHAQAIISIDGLMIPTVGAHIQTFQPVVPRSAAFTLFAGDKLRRLPRTLRGNTRFGFQRFILFAEFHDIQ